MTTVSINQCGVEKKKIEQLPYLITAEVNSSITLLYLNFTTQRWCVKEHRYTYTVSIWFCFPLFKHGSLHEWTGIIAVSFVPSSL